MDRKTAADILERAENFGFSVDEWPDVARATAVHFGPAEALRQLGEDGLRPAFETPEKSIVINVASGVDAAESYVHQDSGLLPRRTFLRLHREGAFPTVKVGKKVFARRADVEKALADRRKRPDPLPPTEPEVVDDGLDDIRLAIGLLPKGGR